MATQEELNKFKTELKDVSDDDLNNSGLQLEVLFEIYKDYQEKHGQLTKHLNMLTENLDEIFDEKRNVHSIKKRVKKPLTLIRKIIKKSLDQDPVKKEKYSKIDKTNYLKNISDILGIRIVTLFATDWLYVNELLEAKFNNDICKLGSKEAKIPPSIDSIIYEEKKFAVIRNEVEYFSLHYDYLTKGFFGETNLEIQVRPIYIEAWAEIDHKIHYKGVFGQEISDPYFKSLSKISLTLDDLSTHALQIKKTMMDYEQKILKLESEIKSSNIPEPEKARFLSGTRYVHSGYRDLEMKIKEEIIKTQKDFNNSNQVEQLKNEISKLNPTLLQNQRETLNKMKDQFLGI